MAGAGVRWLLQGAPHCLRGEHGAPDPHTWIVNTGSPDIWLHWDLTDAQGALGAPVPSAHYQSVGDEEFAKNPIGTGPSASQSSASAISWSSQRWKTTGGKVIPQWRRSRLRKVPEESTRIAALKTDEADIITVSRENVNEIRDAGLQVFLREGQAIVGFYFHQQWEDVPIANVKVREAMNLAVNREELQSSSLADWPPLAPFTRCQAARP